MFVVFSNLRFTPIKSPPTIYTLINTLCTASDNKNVISNSSYYRDIRVQNVSRLKLSNKFLKQNSLEHFLRAMVENPESLSVEEKRNIYAKYGLKSGLDPGILWPTKKELSDMKEYEQLFEPSIQQMSSEIEKEKESQKQAYFEKEMLMREQMKQMPKRIKEYRERLLKKELLEQENIDKRKSIMDEARDYFGFDIDPSDPRFEEMQEKKAEEAAKLKKQLKKEQKQKKMLLNLQKMSKGEEITKDNIEDEKEKVSSSQ